MQITRQTKTKNGRISSLEAVCRSLSMEQVRKAVVPVALIASEIKTEDGEHFALPESVLPFLATPDRKTGVKEGIFLRLARLAPPQQEELIRKDGGDEFASFLESTEAEGLQEVARAWAEFRSLDRGSETKKALFYTLLALVAEEESPACSYLLSAAQAAHRYLLARDKEDPAGELVGLVMGTSAR